jgi:hypothetical protein
LAPSSVPGVSLLMWMYQCSQPAASRRTRRLPEMPLSSRMVVTVPSVAATSGVSFAPRRSFPRCARPPLRGSPQSSTYVTLPATGNVSRW